MSKQQHQEIVNTPDFGDQVTFTVGISYAVGFFLGMGKGLIRGLPKSRKLPRKLFMNNVFNTVGTETSKIANAFAGAGFLYFCVGKTLNMLAEDQLDDLSPLQTNMLCGALTGAIFKSTLGAVPSLFGFVLGAGISGGLHKAIEYGNQTGHIDF